MNGHDGSDGSTPGERMHRYIKDLTTCASENLSYGESRGLAIILSLFVDDGVESRGHRENMINPDLVYIGCFTGAHKNFETMTALNYAGPCRLTELTPNPADDLLENMKLMNPTFSQI
jgi:uncharacterized protein YkwD